VLIWQGWCVHVHVHVRVRVRVCVCVCASAQRLRSMGRVNEVWEWMYYGYMVAPTEATRVPLDPTRQPPLDGIRALANHGFVSDLGHAEVP
jgi:hypothetical protein